MASVVEVNVSTFRARFPAFSDKQKYTDAQLQNTLDKAQCYISPLNFGALKGQCRELAIYLMAAHLQTLEDRINARQTQATFTTGTTIDKITITLAPPPNKTQLDYWYNLTIYGTELQALLLAKAPVGFYFGGEFEQVLR